MTSLYFVRHAQPDRSVHDDMTRPLTQEGLRDSLVVTQVLSDKEIDYIISSPYKRSIDTVRNFAESVDLEIHTNDALRERNAGCWHGDNFFEFIAKQWSDFSYRILDGECLNDVQIRNINAIKDILKEHRNKNIVIATHGTALSTILNYYYPQFDFECFCRIVDLMPFVIRLDFEDDKIINAQVELAIRKEFKKK